MFERFYGFIKRQIESLDQKARKRKLEMERRKLQ